MFWKYALWISTTILYNFLVCYLSVKYNSKDFVKGWLTMWAVGVIPNWSIAAYYSRNLVADGLLYDALLVVSSPLVMLWLGQGAAFTWVNYLGVVVAITGIMMVRVSH